MIIRLRHWLKPAVFVDEEKNRISRNLNSLQLVLLMASIVVSGITLISNNLTTSLILLLGSFCVLASMIIARRGNIPLASIFILLALLGIQNYLLFLGQGIHDIASIIYPIGIILASMLLDTRWFSLYIGLSIISVAGVVYGDISRATNSDYYLLTSWADFVMVAVMLLVTAVSVRLLTSDLTKSLQHARQQEHILANTNQQLAQQTNNLQVSEARWRSLVANVPDIILNVGPNGIIEFTNLTSSEDSNTLIGKNLVEFVKPEEKARLQATLQQVLSTQKPLQYETQVRVFENEYRWLNTRVGPIVQNGSVQSLTMIATDVTARKETEAMLLESESRYRSLFENSPISLWENDFSQLKPYLQDIKGRKPAEMSWGFFFQENPWIVYRCAQKIRVISVNQMTQDLLHAANKDEIYSNLITIFSLEGLVLFQKAMASLLEGQTTFSGDTQLKTLTGPVVHVAYHVAIAPGYETNWEKVFVSLLDITERQTAKTEREALIAELETKNSELERFTYTVSHDLKSPLITIQGFLGFLQKDIDEENWEQLGEDIDQIKQATEKMRTLLNDLLELSRIGRLVNPAQAIPFRGLIHEAMKLVAGQIAQKQVQIHIQSGLPVVYGDQPRLVEVLQNLLDNAIKYMGDQTRPAIRIGTLEKDEKTTFFIQDNGVGIDPRYQTKVFGLFERLDQSVEGTGIGLALVKRIVEVHNGRIWVESKGKGHGCTFYFTLPLANKEA